MIIYVVQSSGLRQKYMTGNSYDDISYIFFELESSALVSDLYGLMRRILYLIFNPPH